MTLERNSAQAIRDTRALAVKSLSKGRSRRSLSWVSRPSQYRFKLSATNLKSDLVELNSSKFLLT